MRVSSEKRYFLIKIHFRLLVMAFENEMILLTELLILCKYQY